MNLDLCDFFFFPFSFHILSTDPNIFMSVFAKHLFWGWGNTSKRLGVAMRKVGVLSGSLNLMDYQSRSYKTPNGSSCF